MLRQKVKAIKNCPFESANRNNNGPNSRSKASKIGYRVPVKVKVAGRRRNRSWAKIDMKSEVLERKVLLDLPIRTISEANCFEPWRAKHGRHKEQQRIVALGLNPLKAHVRLPCHIRLIRFAPDRLDAFDNLPMSFKYIVDAVCAIITGEFRAGKADGDERLTISCDQVKSDAYGVRIEVSW